MKYSHSLLVLCTVLTLGQASPAWTANSIESDLTTAVIQIELNAGLLTLKTEAAPLYEVLNRVGKLTGFSTIRIAADSDPQLVNVSFDNLPIEQLVARLVENTNRIIFYSQAGDGTQRRVISQIWLLGPGNADDDYDEKSVIYNVDLQQADGRKRSEAALRLSQQSVPGLSAEDSRGEIIGRLGRLLHEDHDALVRSRAAIALGGLNDPRAVADLELALLDENSTVRSQAINALGRIGGETATMALGNILLTGTSKTVDRIMAAQALWKHDSESARAYLRAGTNDLDEQVRQASNKAPLPVSNELSNRRTGQEESE